jgi:hypothetical protein
MNASQPPPQRVSLRRTGVFPKTFRHWFRFPNTYSSATAGPGEKAIGVGGVADGFLLGSVAQAARTLESLADKWTCTA